jgi:hypothetical protein
MPKAEIGWRREHEEDGERWDHYAQHVGKEWRFFQRLKRYDQWQAVANPALEDWLTLLDSVRRLIVRRRLMPDDEARLVRRIRERFPEAKLE